MYIANHYIRINGHLLCPGEPIPEDLSEAKKEWFLKVDAIRKSKRPAPVEEPAPVEPAPVEEPAAEPDEGPIEDLVVEIDSMAGIVTDTEPTKPAKPRKGKGAAKS